MNAERPFSQALWDQTPAAVQDYGAALEARVAVLETAVRRLEVVVQHLTEHVQQNSRNASRPPSSDPPQAPGKASRREPSGRRPGGQPGHEGHTRALVPVEEVDAVIPVKPERCSRCQHPVQGEDPQPQRQQVTEIPPVKPVVTEYQRHALVCPACGEATRAALPPGVPTGGFGPRLQATTAVCTGAYHLSKRTTQKLLDDLFGVAVGLGTIAHLEQATIQAVAEPVAEARAYVQTQAAAYADETGWREGRQRTWLWTVVTAWVTVFVVRRSRSGQVAQELLGQDCWGWLVTDRWSGYHWDPTWRRQLCWAHLLRDIEAMIARGGRSAEIGKALRVQARNMVHWWHRVRDGTLTQASFRTYMPPIRRDVERRLEAGQRGGIPKTEGTSREIFTWRQALWTFVRHPGVEPTNNAAESAIRPGVLWRKGSFGTHSPEGSRFVEVMMTVVATLTQPHRNVLDDVMTACEATRRGEPAPSLLPTPTESQQLLHPAA
ncbi:MAG: IS66 family transposase [Candidatus Entotheonellia bacterium]